MTKEKLKDKLIKSFFDVEISTEKIMDYMFFLIYVLVLKVGFILLNTITNTPFQMYVIISIMALYISYLNYFLKKAKGFFLISYIVALLDLCWDSIDFSTISILSLVLFIIGQYFYHKKNTGD